MFHFRSRTEGPDRDAGTSRPRRHPRPRSAWPRRRRRPRRDAGDRHRGGSVDPRHRCGHRQRADPRGVMEHYDRPHHPRPNHLPTAPGPTTTRSRSPSSPRARRSPPDGKSVTFKLRPDATFHDGTPVTAKDVEWSFDRAVAVGGFPAIQMGASEMTSPDQFVVDDDHTFRVDFPRPNKLILPNLAVPIAKVINFGARQEERHRRRPWALDWVGKNDAGSGAYMVESLEAPLGDRRSERFDDWKSGPSLYLTPDRQPPDPLDRHPPGAPREGRRRLSSFNLPPKRLLRPGRNRRAGRWSARRSMPSSSTST